MVYYSAMKNNEVHIFYVVILCCDVDECQKHYAE